MAKKNIRFWMEMMMVSDLRLSLAEFLFSSSFWPPRQGSHSDEQHPTVLKICTCNNGPYHGMSSHGTKLQQHRKKNHTTNW